VWPVAISRRSEFTEVTPPRLLSAMSLLSSPSALQGSIVTSEYVHDKRGSLSLYVTPKIHACIRDSIWSKIIVKGCHTRTPSAKFTDNEKHHQLFNWQRPTATLIDKSTLQINCFPGCDYVEHYARVISTYLHLNGRNDEVVVQKPAPREAYFHFMHSSNLASLGEIKVVVVGDIHCFTDLQDVSWDGDSEDSSETSLFQWKIIHQSGAPSFAFLGCKVGLWGDIAGQLLMALKTLSQIEYCIYIGKAGSLRVGDIPNTQIATGMQSFIGENLISWDPQIRVSHSEVVHKGLHTTIASPLLEIEEWLADSLAKGVSWVDCEVGYMAQAAKTCSVSFTYLHIISDNVAKVYDFNLSNEDEAQVITSRDKLFNELWTVLQMTLMENFGLDISRKALIDSLETNTKVQHLTVVDKAATWGANSHKKIEFE
jgi:hypothetical protein